MSRDRSERTLTTALYGETKHRVARRRLAGIVVVVVIGVASAVLGARALRAATAPSVAVSPASVAEVYYKPTPITITINAANLSGFGQTPVSGYQYGLQWDPSVLRWLSGPGAGPGTPTPQPVLPCGPQVSTVVTPTATPTNFVPTYTPTSTITATATSTPAMYTPTATATVTLTPTATPTPGGYIQVACATLSNATPVASGVLGTFTFQPLATAQAGSPLSLINVKLVDFYGNPVTPGPGVASGEVNLVACHDVNGDGVVSLTDLILIDGDYGAKVGDPNYVATYDVNGDGKINLTDLIIEDAAYGLKC